MFNAVGESWDWASFYGLSIGIEVLLLAFILRYAWKFRPETARAESSREPVSAR